MNTEQIVNGLMYEKTMNPEQIINGLIFAKKHNLNQNEIICLIPFFEKAYTVKELAEKNIIKYSSLHPTLFKLKLKNLIFVKDTDKQGNHLLELKEEEFYSF